MRTATDLLVEGGPWAVTVDAIVARSGVAKSTIYRHWPSRDDILLDVMHNCAPQFTPPDPQLSFDDALRDLFQQFITLLNDPEWARVFPALLALKSHQPDVAEIEEEIEQRQHNALAAVLERAADEGRIRHDYDLESVAAMLVGPLFLAHVAGRPPVTMKFAEQVIAAVLAANAP